MRSANMQAFLDMIAVSEGTSTTKGSDNGYNVIVGRTLFHDYSDHPRVMVDLPKLKIKSSAAGRYQILMKIFDHYKAQLKLPDFSPASQDAIAIQLIRECKAIADVEAGRFADAVHKCRSRWASLPGAGYGQHENTLAKLQGVYTKSGGLLA